MKRILTFAAITVLTLFVFTSCGEDVGKDELCKFLYSDYQMQMQFLIECGEESVSGTANVGKNDEVRMDITSPDPFTGLGVTTEGMGEPKTISLSFSGIKATLPAEAVSRVSMMLSAFCNEAAAAAENTEAKRYKKCEEMFEAPWLSQCDPYEVSFTLGENEYLYIYDKFTGNPVNVCIKNGDTVAEIKIDKIKTEE